MPTQSDKEWIATLREHVKADFHHFYILHFELNGSEYVKPGWTGESNLLDRGRGITDTRKKPIQFKDENVCAIG